MKQILSILEVNSTLKKLVLMIKRNYSTLITVIIICVLLFIPEAKAMMQQGLMKVGFFQPNLENSSNNTQLNTDNSFSFSMVDANGKTLNLEELKGKVVFINFWATWCAPCIAEMPSIQKLYDKVKTDKDIVILTVEIDGKSEKALKFMQNKNLTLPVYFPQSAIPTEFLKGSIPTTIILDKKGNMAHKTIGMADYSGQDIIDFLNELKAMN